MRRPPPPASVLGAFGATGRLEHLSGGQGAAWRVGNIVLKPEKRSVAELEWYDRLYTETSWVGLRVAEPVRTLGGALQAEGWTATRYLEGDVEQDVGAVIEAGADLHRALRTRPRPSFIDDRDDAWAIGDRVAWGELDWRLFGSAPDVVLAVATPSR